MTADERCEQRVALRDARAVVASPYGYFWLRCEFNNWLRWEVMV